jgi:hypothetical protein
LFILINIGLINPDCIALIGNGVVVHLPSFFEEKAKIEAKGKNFEKKEKKRRGKKGEKKFFLWYRNQRDIYRFGL